MWRREFVTGYRARVSHGRSLRWRRNPGPSYHLGPVISRYHVKQLRRHRLSFLPFKTSSDIPALLKTKISRLLAAILDLILI